MTTIQSISQEIDKLVEANTLSGAGVKAMEALRVKVIALESSGQESASRVRVLEGQLGTANSANVSLTSSIAAWTAREAALVKRELEITKLEKDAAVAAGKSQTYQECFALVFRNAEIRETLKAITPMTVPTPGGSHYVQNNETRTEVTRQQT